MTSITDMQRDRIDFKKEFENKPWDGVIKLRSVYKSQNDGSFYGETIDGDFVKLMREEA